MPNTLKTIEILAEGAANRFGRRHRRNPDECKYCKRKVLWCETAAGKPILFDENPEAIERSEDGGLETVSTEHVHFSTCKKQPQRPGAGRPDATTSRLWDDNPAA